MARKINQSRGGNINYRQLAALVVNMARAYERAWRTGDRSAAFAIFSAYGKISQWARQNHYVECFQWWHIGLQSIR